MESSTTIASALAYSPISIPLHAVADLTMFLACSAIAVAVLLYLYKKQPEFKLSGYIIAGFIGWIGIVNLGEFFALWYPVHLVLGVAKGITAFIVIIGSITLFPLIPRFLNILTPHEYEATIRALYKANGDLKDTVEDHANQSKAISLELTNRVRNTIATVHGIAKETARNVSDVKTFLKAFNARLVGITHCNELLLSNSWKGAMLREVVKSQLNQFSAHKNTLIEGPDVFLKPSAVQQISLAMHELAANTPGMLLNGASSKCSVSWSKHSDNTDHDTLRFTYVEPRNKGANPPDYKGFGHSVLNFVVPTALNGLSDLKIKENDIHWDLEVPMDSVTA